MILNHYLYIKCMKTKEGSVDMTNKLQKLSVLVNKYTPVITAIANIARIINAIKIINDLFF